VKDREGRIQGLARYHTFQLVHCQEQDNHCEVELLQTTSRTENVYSNEVRLKTKIHKESENITHRMTKVRALPIANLQKTRTLSLNNLYT
jgi:hypothetical protein